MIGYLVESVALRVHLLRDHHLDCPRSDTLADLRDEHRAAHEYEARTTQQRGRQP
jgi:hypothetical protein